ncbi:MAG: thioredoxin [Clostridiales bacterium]|nr:thioredoxin [Clostridiales bacterium]MBQ2817878.1 thioredoxin [Clostridia bacterium]MBQ4637501.1 thioredoxin [Clostridia bacterium]
MAEVKITKANFDQEVIKSDIPVLLDFWAVWCGPCRMIAPILEQIANENEGKVKIGKVNVDEEPELAASFGIASIPTLIVFKDGKPVQAAVGVRPKAQIEAMLK